MALGDLAHEGKAEAPAAGALAGAAGTVERLEDALALLRRQAAAGVAHGDRRAGAVARHGDGDRRSTVLDGVVEQVTYQPPQQHRVALDLDRLARQVGIVARRLLGGKAEQVDALAAIPARLGVIEPARQQQLLDEPVHLDEVAHDLRARRVLRFAQPDLDCHAQARQRGAQLVAGVGEKRLLRGEQAGEPGRRLVEGAPEQRDLVVAALLEAGRRAILAPARHAGAQRLEPPSQQRRDGIGG